MDLLTDNGKFSDEQIAAYKKYKALKDKNDVNPLSFTATEELKLTRQEHAFLMRNDAALEAQLKGMPSDVAGLLPENGSVVGTVVTRDVVNEEQRRGGPQVNLERQEEAYKESTEFVADTVKRNAPTPKAARATPVGKEDKQVEKAIKDNTAA